MNALGISRRRRQGGAFIMILDRLPLSRIIECNMTRKLRLFAGLLVVLVLFGGGFALAWELQVHAASQVARDQETYPLLSKRIFMDDPNDTLINFVPLRNKLNDRFNALTVRKSLYFEYLPDGTSIRIGADNNIIAASLMKVPLVMNLYRAAELGRINLDDKSELTASELNSDYGDLYKKGTGYQLTYRQAAQLVLEQSDNTATRFIYDHVNNLLQPSEQSLASLDIDQDVANNQAVINARSYTSVLKGLYYGAYLNDTDSQAVLGYLSHSAEHNRLTKLLPSSVVVAHKNGVYNANSWAQSDCGIFYVPKRPYMLCILVELPDDQADAIISQTSKDVYDFVTSQKN